MLVKNGTAFIGGRFARADVRVENGKIAQIGDLQPREGEDVRSAAGLYVLPGFVDIHIHAYAGADCMRGEDDVRRMSEGLLKTGVAAFMPTTMSAPIEATHRALESIQWVKDHPCGKGAAVLGAHEEENERLKAIEKFCGADAFWLLAEKAIGYTGNRDAAELACYPLTSAALLNAPEDAFAGLPGAAARTAFCTRLQSRSSSRSASPCTVGAAAGVRRVTSGQAACSRGQSAGSGTAVSSTPSSFRPSRASSLRLSASSRRPSCTMAAAASRCSSGSVCMVWSMSA